MKKVLLLSLVCGMYVGVSGQKGKLVTASVIAVDKTNNKVIARQTADGIVFIFLTNATSINLFAEGNEINADYGLNKIITTVGASVPVSFASVASRAFDFRLELAKLDAAMSSGQNISALYKTGNEKLDLQELMVNPHQEAPGLLKGCCYSIGENLGKGVEFRLTPGITRSDIETKIYRYHNLVIAEKMNYSSLKPLLSFLITSEWIDSINYGTQAGGKEGWNQMNNAKKRPASGETEKWVITPDEKMKGVLGRLNSGFPDDVTWTMDIYTQADNKMVNLLTNNHNIKSSSLSPGEYAIKFTGVQLENVPIQKGSETRLKAGFLNIVSDGSWDLYDAAKEKIITTNTKQQKIALPVGNYFLKLGGQFYPVLIKDGETIEY